MSASDRQVRERFETLLDRAERLRLSFDELRELAHLYRLSSARLAVLRSHESDPEAVRYLNALCVRAYTRLQVPARRKQGARSFFLSDFPATLAATARMQELAALLMVAGAVISATIVSENPGALYAFIPRAMYPADVLQRLAGSAQARARFLAHHHTAFGIKSIFSAALFVHNTQLGFLAFATGILAGIPTLLLDLYNGLTLGAFAWIFSCDAGWPVFWAWLLPHAIPELLGVTLCSAGGLVIAKALVAPGRRGVGVAVRAAAGPALQLALASVPLFFIAAGIESFLRQSALATGARFAFAGVTLAALGGYGWYVRKLSRRLNPPEAGWLLKEALPGESPDSGSEPAR